MYEYNARVIRVVDADTVWLDVDLGFDVRRRDSFRLFGIDAPEMSTPEGREAKAYVEAVLADYPEVVLHTVKDRREKYGRYLATIYAGGTSLNQAIVDQGHAVLRTEADASS